MSGLDPTPAVVARYESLLDRLCELSRHALRAAPTWEAGLFSAFSVGLEELADEPGALELHYLHAETHAPLRAVRQRQRAELIELFCEERDDGPGPLYTEALLGMIHTLVRTRMETYGTVAPLASTQDAIALVLFPYVREEQAH